MDKVKLEFVIPKEEIIKYGEHEIKIVPFLQTAQQVVLINNYVDDYFSEREDKLIKESKYNYLEAELNLMNYILQSVTNIDISDFNANLYSDIVLWDNIKKSIINYDEFRKRLDMVVEIIKENIALENSLGKVVENLINKINEFVDKAGNISPEVIEQARIAGLEMLDELKKSSVLGNVEEQKGKNAKW